MPAGPNVPAVLAEAYEGMERHVQHFKKTLPFTAPEMMDLHYAELQQSLAETMAHMHRLLTDPVYRAEWDAEVASDDNEYDPLEEDGSDEYADR